MPEVKKDGMVIEDEAFRAYLEAHGVDVSRMGLPVEHDEEASQDADKKKEKDSNGVSVSAREV